MSEKRKRSKAWRATVRGKQDVLVVRLAYLLREQDYSGSRRTLVNRALAFIGDPLPKWD